MFMNLNDFIDVNVSAFTEDYSSKVKAKRKQLLSDNKDQLPALGPMPDLKNYGSPDYVDSCIDWNARGGSPRLRLDWTGEPFSNSTRTLLAQDLAIALELYSLVLGHPLPGMDPDGDRGPLFIEDGYSFETFMDDTIGYYPWMRDSRRRVIATGLVDYDYDVTRTILFTSWLTDRRTALWISWRVQHLQSILEFFFRADMLTIPVTRGFAWYILSALYLTTRYPDDYSYKIDNGRICDLHWMFPYINRPAAPEQPQVSEGFRASYHKYDNDGNETWSDEVHTIDGKDVDDVVRDFPTFRDKWARGLYETCANAAKQVGAQSLDALRRYNFNQENMTLTEGYEALRVAVSMLTEVTGYRVNYIGDQTNISMLTKDVSWTHVRANSSWYGSDPDPKKIVKTPDGLLDGGIFLSSSGYVTGYIRNPSYSSTQSKGTGVVASDTGEWDQYLISRFFNSYDNDSIEDAEGDILVFVHTGERSWVGSGQVKSPCTPIVELAKEATVWFGVIVDNDATNDYTTYAKNNTGSEQYPYYRSVTVDITQEQKTERSYIPIEMPLTLTGYTDKQDVTAQQYPSMVTNDDGVAHYHPYAVYTFKFSDYMSKIADCVKPVEPQSSGTGGFVHSVIHYSFIRECVVLSFDFGININI